MGQFELTYADGRTTRVTLEGHVNDDESGGGGHLLVTEERFRYHVAIACWSPNEKTALAKIEQEYGFKIAQGAWKLVQKLPYGAALANPQSQPHVFIFDLWTIEAQVETYPPDEAWNQVGRACSSADRQ